MKLNRFSLVAGMMVLALMTPDLMAQRRGRRGNAGDPNWEDKLQSPFQGNVASVSATSISVRGKMDAQLAKVSRQAEGEDIKIHFSIKPDTKILRGGKPITADQIDKDEPVRVTFTRKQGSSIKNVSTIEVGSFAAPEAGKAKGKAAGGKKPGKKKDE
jgi:hypothetical protein